MNPKPFLIIMGVSFGIFILCAVVDGVLQSKLNYSIYDLDPRWSRAMMVFSFVLFLLIGISMVPLALRYFVIMQIKIGNGEFAPVRWLAEHERQVVYACWGMIAVGLAISLPAAIRDGFFK